jgi:glutathione synthase/RimK-type ligase-like ATP-grasp enzyme
MPRFTVAAFLRSENITDYPLSKEDYQLSYFELSQAVAALGGEMFMACGQKSYQGNGVFSEGWLIDAPGKYTKMTSPKADVIFDKGGFVSDATVPIFNHPELSEICSDKFVMYQKFAEYCPKTFLARDQKELAEALAALATPMGVIKPVDGFEGHDVFIQTIKKLHTGTYTFPVLVQEFMDTSGGIPGIIEGTHDLRVALFNDTILYSYVRTPPPGKFTANVAQGGTFRMIDVAQLPTKVTDIVKKIDAQMAQYGPRFYGIDIGMTPQGPRLIEMNSKLGLLPNRDDTVFVTLKEKLAAAFQELSQ